MKPTSDFLWQLIHSLNSNEKLFFKRNFLSSHTSGVPIYLQLFDAIASQKIYDESAILSKFAPAIQKKNIASQKHYLQSLVCDALIEYDSREDASHAIYQQILLIRVFRKKGLLEEALNIWKKAVRTARTDESFPMVNLLKAEFEKTVLLSSANTRYEELYAIFNDHFLNYREYIDMITQRDIYADVVLQKRKVHFDLNESQRNHINSLLSRVNACESVHNTQSFWFRHYYNMNKATLLYLLNDIPASLNICRHVLKAWQERPSFVGSHGEYYIELLNMINHTGIWFGDFDFVESAFASPLNNMIIEKTQRANFETIRYLALNKIYHKEARYTDTALILVSMKSSYKKWEPSLNHDLSRTLNISLGISCFVLEQFQDALFFVKRAITHFKDGTREEQAAISNVFLLLITYCLNNSRLFDAQYKSTYNYFYKAKKKWPWENALVNCLNKTFYITGRARIVEFNKALAVLKENYHNPLQQKTLGIFNYEGWLVSQIEGMPYKHFVERTVRGKKNYNLNSSLT